HDYAVGDDVHHGAVCGRAAALLDNLEHPDHRAAVVSLFQASTAKSAGPERGGRQETRGRAGRGSQGRNVISHGESGPDGELEARAARLFSGPVTFLKSAPALKFLPDA